MDPGDLKERRKARGWTRAELAHRAHVDPRSLQLIELGLSNDDESLARCIAALDAPDGPVDPTPPADGSPGA